MERKNKNTIGMQDTVSPNWERKEPPRERTEKEKAYWAGVPVSPSSNLLEKPVHLKRFIDAELNRKVEGWAYTDQNKGLLNALVWYTLGNQYELTKSQYSTGKGKSCNTLDLKKGVLIYGGYGVGKTTIARIFAKLWKFKQATCINVIQEHPNWKKYEMGSWYFDDLGAEMEPMYAKRSNLKAISALLEQRYYNGQNTLITTNLTPEEIGEQYGERMEDRIWEQFNIFSLLGESFRRK